MAFYADENPSIFHFPFSMSLWFDFIFQNYKYAKQQQIYVDVGSDHINLLRCWAVILWSVNWMFKERLLKLSQKESHNCIWMPYQLFSIYQHYKSWQDAF